jgi:hypothetical protein
MADNPFLQSSKIRIECISGFHDLAQLDEVVVQDPVHVQTSSIAQHPHPDHYNA